MKIKLIALDLDGTLLNSKKEISNRTRKTLMKCIEKGIHIVPATGRTVDGIPESLKNIKGVDYAITTNGAVVADIVNNIVIEKKPLSNKLALEIINQIRPYKAIYDPYMEGRGKSQPEFIEHLNEYGLSEEMQKLVIKTRDIVPDIYQYVEQSKIPVEKINMFFADMEERQVVMALLEKRRDVIITSSLCNNLEINSPEATKGNGLRCLADYIGIKIEETMALGDGNNDISMIKSAGVGVAMDNALEEVKRAADFITLNNDQDGVADAIERFVFS